MRTSVLLICSVLATAAYAEKAKEAAPDKKAAPADKATAEFKAWAEKMNTAMTNMDTAYVKNAISDTPWATWDTDEAGRPNGFTNKADAVKMIEGMHTMMKAMGAKIAYTPKLFECKVSGQMGVCMQDGEMTLTSDKMPPMTMAFRETNIAMKEKAGWKWVHHHGSLAKWPEAPAKSMAMTARTAKWMELPGMTSMKMSPVWMNQAHGTGAALLKVGPEGMKQARHIHPYGSAFLIIEGSMTTTVDGKDTEYGPGSVVYRAPKEVHTSSAKPGTVMFAVTDGPMASVMVDDKGNPLPPQAAAPTPAKP